MLVCVHQTHFNSKCYISLQSNYGGSLHLGLFNILSMLNQYENYMTDACTQMHIKMYIKGNIIITKNIFLKINK